MRNARRCESAKCAKTNGDPGAIRTRDPQLRRLFRKSYNLLVLLRYSGNLVRSRSAMRCQEVPLPREGRAPESTPPPRKKIELQLISSPLPSPDSHQTHNRPLVGATRATWYADAWADFRADFQDKITAHFSKLKRREFFNSPRSLGHDDRAESAVREGS